MPNGKEPSLPKHPPGPVQVALPSTWVPFEKENCTSCWAGCCHSMPVEVSVPDLIRMGHLTEMDAVTGLNKAAKRLIKEGIVTEFRSKSVIFVLRQRENGDCIFLDAKRRCSIYLKRPQICREFPKIGPKPGFCPYIKI